MTAAPSSGRPPQVSSAAVRQTAACVSSAVIMQSTACQQRLRQADHRESAAPSSCRPPRVSAAPPSCSPPHDSSAFVRQTTASQQRRRHADRRVCQQRRHHADRRVCQQRRHHAVHRMPAAPPSGRPPLVSSAYDRAQPLILPVGHWPRGDRNIQLSQNTLRITCPKSQFSTEGRLRFSNLPFHDEI